MQKIVLFSCLFTLLLASIDYSNQASWATTCTTSVTRQSPIDIPCKDFITTCPQNINYQVYWNNPVNSFGGSTYQDLKTALTNENIWVLFTNATNDYVFKSAQFHLHQPSEHTINGESFPLEMHIVHVLDNPSITQYLVIGFLFEVDNTLTYDFLDYVKINANTSSTHLFPFPVTNKAAYHYLGSLTTPPCTEAVNWFLQTETIKITQQHMDELIAEVGDGHPNNRQVQGLKSRPVYLVGQGCSTA